MKKWMLCGIGTAALLCAFTLGALRLPRTQTVRNDFVLGEYGGCVAVYSPLQSGVPRRVTDIAVQLLPSADRVQLKNGIPVRDDRELLTLLEDLGS